MQQKECRSSWSGEVQKPSQGNSSSEGSNGMVREAFEVFIARHVERLSVSTDGTGGENYNGWIVAWSHKEVPQRRSSTLFWTTGDEFIRVFLARFRWLA